MRIKKMADNGFKIVSSHQLRLELSVSKSDETDEIDTMLIVNSPYGLFMLEHDKSDIEALGFISVDEERAIKKRMEKENTTTYTLHCTYVDQLEIECRPDNENWHMLIIVTGSDGEERRFKTKIDDDGLDKVIFMLCLMHERYTDLDVSLDEIVIEHDKPMGFRLNLLGGKPIMIDVYASKKDEKEKTRIWRNEELYSVFVNLYLGERMYTFHKTRSSLDAINFIDLLSKEDMKLIEDTFNANVLYVTKELSMNLTLLDFNYSALDGKHDVSFGFDGGRGFFDHVGFNEMGMMFLDLISEMFNIRKGESRC